ncbi:7547_t:CDS:2 [Entrophospora sp. SA101]|nr:7547_t:CDS:2 [Entrophospora sp. SA101]
MPKATQDPIMQRLDERDGLNNMSLLKDRMENRQPNRLGETLRVPDGAVHRLNGSGRQTPERVVRPDSLLNPNVVLGCVESGTDEVDLISQRKLIKAM